MKFFASCFSILSLVTTSFVLCQTSTAQTTGAIPQGTIRVAIEEFARLPDTGSGQNAPARANLLTTDPLGRLFVNDQRGQLYTVSGNGSVVTEYLDLNDQGAGFVVSTSEAGFQSFAFHPDFGNAQSAGFGKLYTIHSTSNDATANVDFVSNAGSGISNPHQTVLLEWTAADPTADTYTAATGGGPRELMRFQQPYGNHNAGLISFNVFDSGNDRNNLYIAIGDGGSGGDPPDNAQDLSNPFGAILRIDPLGNNSANGEYGIVGGNVFASDMDNNTLAEIYAYGLRNPQRFGWDSTNGNMFIADIGQGSFEEINLGQNGGNFGWRDREGSFSGGGVDPTNFIDPAAEYDHFDSIPGETGVTGGRAITTGEVVRGGSIAALQGQLLLGDFPTGKIFTLDVDSDPLDGGQDGLFELILIDDMGMETDLLTLINADRSTQGLNDSDRADLRFSIHTNGDIFITNKRDGVIRRLVAVIPEPGCLTALVLACFGIVNRRWRKFC